MFSLKLVGDWGKMSQIARTMQARFKRAIEVAVLKEAQMFRGLIVKGIASQAPGGQPFQPLSPLTLALRKVLGGAGSKALIATNALRGSITVTRSPGAEVKAFVGVLRNAKSKGGRSLANIAEVHEFGATIRKTAKMNRFLHAVAREAGLAKEGLQVGGAVGRAFKDKGGRWRNSAGRFLSGPHLAAAKAAEATSRQVKRGSTPGGGVIRIPARPFIAPILAKYGKPDDVKRRFYARLAQAMDGDFGKVAGAGFGVT
jgi:hypothetical protein